MTATYLLALALWMLSTLSPGPISPEAWAADARPYYERMAGWSAPDPSIYWSSYPAGGWTAVDTGGCYGTIGINYLYRDDYEMTVFVISHELSHQYQGAACWTAVPYRDGGRLLLTSGSNVNLEQTAQLMAMEIRAERCRAGEPGGCYEFWHGMAFNASQTLSHRPYELDIRYDSGPLTRLWQSGGGVVLGAALQRPLLMNDTWALLNAADSQVMKRVK